VKRAGFFIIFILILSFLLNITGINWGVPSLERNSIYFSDKEDIKDTLNGITEEKVVKSQTEYKKELSGARFNPLRSYHPDESQFIESLSNMNIKKFDFNPHYFYYGTLYFWLFGISLGIAFITGFIKLTTSLDFFYSHPEALAKFYIAGRMVSVLFAVLTVFLVFQVSKKLYGEKKALIAALFIAIMPLFVINSHYVAVDITEIFFIVLTLFISLKVLESQNVKWFILGGISAGLAGSAKYPGILAIFFIPLAYFLSGINNWKNFLLCFFRKKVLLSYLCSFFAFIVICPFFITSNSEVMSYIREVRGMDWNFLSGGLFYLKALYNGMGLPLLVISFTGLFFAFYKKEKKELLIIFWVIFSLLFFIVSSKRIDRYILVILPFLAILAPRSLDLFKNKPLRSSIFIFVAVSSFFYTAAYDLVFKQENTRTSAGKWISENIDHDSSIGLRRDPFQYEIPPLNMKRYRFCITGKKSEDVQRSLEINKPDYFILGEAEVPGALQFWNEVITKRDYMLLKEFSNAPKIFGIKFNDINPSEDYLYIYPRIRIYKHIQNAI